jgi:hypothetical protein
MAVYSRSEFCEVSGILTRQISIYVSRGKLYLDENDRIDCDIEPNKTFLQKRLSKGKAKPKPENNIEAEPVVKKIRPKETADYAVLTESMQLDLEQKRYSVKKTKVELELKEIDKQKKLGALIPLDLVKPIMSTLTHSIITEVKNYMEEFLRDTAKIHNISNASIAESKGILVKGLNKAVDKAVDSSLKKVKVIVSEFSETRRVGEHD